MSFSRILRKSLIFDNFKVPHDSYEKTCIKNNKKYCQTNTWTTKKISTQIFNIKMCTHKYLISMFPTSITG